MTMTDLQPVFDFLGFMTGPNFAEKMTLFTVAWLIVRRTIKGEFGKINDSLATLTGSVNELKTAMTTLETGHSSRLMILETEVRSLKEIALGGHISGTSNESV
jgi:hypothetical protein